MPTDVPKLPLGLSIFFPAYNDGGTIASLVILAVQVAGRLTADFEVIVVNDGSGDATKDILDDPHYRARDMIVRQRTRDGHELDVPGIVPKLLGTPGTIRRAAPQLGDDTDEVLGQIGYSSEDIGALRERRIVA